MGAWEWWDLAASGSVGENLGGVYEEFLDFGALVGEGDALS